MQVCRPRGPGPCLKIQVARITRVECSGQSCGELLTSVSNPFCVCMSKLAAVGATDTDSDSLSQTTGRPSTSTLAAVRSDRTVVDASSPWTNLTERASATNQSMATNLPANTTVLTSCSFTATGNYTSQHKMRASVHRGCLTAKHLNGTPAKCAAHTCRFVNVLHRSTEA